MHAFSNVTMGDTYLLILQVVGAIVYEGYKCDFEYTVKNIVPG